MDEYHHLQLAEREAIQGVRDAEQEINDLLEVRAREEQCVVIMTPFSDVALVKKESTPQEEIAKVHLSMHTNSQIYDTLSKKHILNCKYPILVYALCIYLAQEVMSKDWGRG